MGVELFARTPPVRRGTVRSLILVGCSLALLIELPRLADYFREPAFSNAAATPTADVGPAPPSPTEDIGVQSPSPDRSRHADASVVLGGGDQKKAPSLGSSATDRASAPAKSAVLRPRPEINLQGAQDVINGRVPAIVPPPGEAATLSDGYLPPWDAMRGRETAQAAGTIKPTNGTLTMPVAARAEPKRASKKQGRASARRRVRVASPFSFFGF